MLLLLLQDKLVLAPHSTPGKITVPAILGKVSPEKAQQEHIVYLPFVCFYLQPSKALDVTDCKLCLVRNGLLFGDSKTWEWTLLLLNQNCALLKTIFLLCMCNTDCTCHLHPCHSSPAVGACCKAWPNSISCHLEAFCINMRVLPTLTCDLIPRMQL